MAEGRLTRREEAPEALAVMEVGVQLACKTALNWSGDEPPVHTSPDGRETTLAPVSLLQMEMARLRKLLHERNKREA